MDSEHQPIDFEAESRSAAARIARQRYLEMLAGADSPAQLAALIRVIDKVPWEAADSRTEPSQPRFEDLEQMNLAELMSEARRLIAVIEEHYGMEDSLALADRAEAEGQWDSEPPPPIGLEDSAAGGE